MKLAALAAAVLLAPAVAASPPQPPQVVEVAVGHDLAKGFVAGDGRVVTVAHVLGAGDDAKPRGGDPVMGGSRSVMVDGRPATVVRIDRRLDLAVLRVRGLEGEAARFGGGDGTTVLGRPAPIVRHIDARVDGSNPRPVLEVAADVAVGDSGAPVLTATGRVAGVIFARSRTRPRTAYAVDAAAVAPMLERAPLR